MGQEQGQSQVCPQAGKDLPDSVNLDDFFYTDLDVLVK